MRYEESIKSWEDWAYLTWRDMGKMEDELKETKGELSKLKEKYDLLKDDHNKLKWQIYTVVGILILVFGIIEFTINK